MEARLVHSDGEQRTFVLVFAAGDEVVSELTAFARRVELTGSGFTALGAFSEAVVAYFDWETKEYVRTPVKEQVEVLALVGDIAVAADGPKVHAHCVLGRRDTSTRGGHLMEARVRPTLEVTLVESPAHLRRVPDARSGLALIDPGA
ncbi:MAG: PPC domain-containing DNA-binding protein [Vicinamibacterales bacterium]